MAKFETKFRPNGRASDVDDPEGMTNGEKAAQAEAALTGYYTSELEIAVTDLLADLMHLAHREDLDFYELLASAEMHFSFER